MDTKTEKCVIIIDENAPLGIMANITSILSISLGKNRSDIVGADTVDKDGHIHPGLVQVPVPVLKASEEKMAEIRKVLFGEDYADVSCVDFTDVAQKCMTYEDYTNGVSETAADEFRYLGLGLSGNKKKINKLTGSLGLLR